MDIEQYDKDFLGNFEAEAAVLGILLTNPEKIEKVELSADDFYSTGHQAIFSSIKRLSSFGLPIDVITVYDDLNEQQHSEFKGGLKYLGELTQGWGSAGNISRYVDLIKDSSTKRKLHAVGQSIAKLAGLKGEELTSKINESMFLLNNLTSESLSDEPTTSKDAVIRAVESITARLTNNGIQGVPTGIKRLDGMLGGFLKGQLIIVAGRPSMGKTSLVMQSAESASIAGKKVLIFSLEMSETELVERMLASISGLGMGKIKSGNMTKIEYGRLSAASTTIAEMPFRIVDRAGLSVDKIRTISRRFQLKHGLDMIIVDQLSHIPTKGNNLAQEIGKNTSALKQIAKDLNIPVVVASQLNRESAKANQVRRPTLTDIRDSGSVEQDADVVLMIHREGYYDERANPTEAEIIIAKQRQGARGITVNVGWQGMFTRFTEEPDGNWKAPLNVKQTYEDDLV